MIESFTFTVLVGSIYIMQLSVSIISLVCFVLLFTLSSLLVSLPPLSLLAPPLAAQVPVGLALSPGDVLPGLANVDVGLKGDTGLLPPAPPAPVGGAWGIWGAPRGGRGATRLPYGATLEPRSPPAPTSP